MRSSGQPQSLESSVPKTALISDTKFMSGGFQTLKFNNLLERFKELTESCYTNDYGLLQGKDRD